MASITQLNNGYSTRDSEERLVETNGSSRIHRPSPGTHSGPRTASEAYEELLQGFAPYPGTTEPDEVRRWREQHPGYTLSEAGPRAIVAFQRTFELRAPNTNGLETLQYYFFVRVHELEYGPSYIINTVTQEMPGPYSTSPQHRGTHRYHPYHPPGYNLPTRATSQPAPAARATRAATEQRSARSAAAAMSQRNSNMSHGSLSSSGTLSSNGSHSMAGAVTTTTSRHDLSNLTAEEHFFLANRLPIRQPATVATVRGHFGLMPYLYAKLAEGCRTWLNLNSRQHGFWERRQTLWQCSLKLSERYAVLWMVLPKARIQRILLKHRIETRASKYWEKVLAEVEEANASFILQCLFTAGLALSASLLVLTLGWFRIGVRGTALLTMAYIAAGAWAVNHLCLVLHEKYSDDNHDELELAEMFNYLTAP